MPEITRLPAHLRARAADTLIQAFQDDIIKRTFLPDSKRRQRLAKWVFQGLLRYCDRWGVIHADPQANGIACWLPPGATTPSEWRMLLAWDLLPGPYWLAGWRAAQDFFALQDFTDSQHKLLIQRPHWYLWALAVRPECQGQGLGGRLLVPQLEAAASAGLPCYLETQTERNVAFYARRGFQVVRSAQVKGVRIWFMLRE